MIAAIIGFGSMIVFAAVIEIMVPMLGSVFLAMLFIFLVCVDRAEEEQQPPKNRRM